MNLNFFSQILKQTKSYLSSDNFEDELDYLILNLQMFDSGLSVPNMDPENQVYRIRKKSRIVLTSLKRLNLEYAPLGIAAGTFFGPKGSAAGSFLGTYIFLGCASASVWRHFHQKTQQKLISVN